MSDRQLKFRAWDESTKIMHYPDNFNGLHTDKYNSGEILKRFDCCMQFTGITDKNGKEIYEGDIIRYRNVVRTTQTHYGDNIPNGSYTEPMEAAIVTKEEPVVFENGVFCIESGDDFKMSIFYEDSQPTEESIKDAIAVYKSGKEYSIWDSPEEGDLQFLLEEYKLKDLAELINYVSGIEVIGNIYETPEPLKHR